MATIISRFYGFLVEKPYVHSIRKEFLIDETKNLKITAENKHNFVHDDDTDYLPEGDYIYLNNNFYFKKKPTVAASSLSRTEFMSHIKLVDTSMLIPPNEVVLKVVTIGLQVTQEDATLLMGVGDDNWASERYKEKVYEAVKSADKIQLPELGHTTGLGSYLNSFLGDEFEVFKNQSILNEHLPLCRYATSHPDHGFYHRTKCIVGNTVLGSALAGSLNCLESMTASIETEPPHTLVAEGDEDKNATSGESQAVAAMLIMATRVGIHASIENKYFDRALIYGHVRTIVDGDVRPYWILLKDEV